MDELEFALDNIGGRSFEDFAMAFLREEGYGVHESGSPGADGGWDARIELGDMTGIVHASTQKRWKGKLRDDAEKVQDLEEDQGDDYDLLVFVTNQNVTGAQELEMETEIEDEYGWRLKLIHRKNILGELRQNKKELAADFLDIDLQHDKEHLEEIEDFRDERLDEIRNREGYASDLADGPLIALHVIPNAIFSREKVHSASEIPNPPAISSLVGLNPETRGKYKITYGQHGRIGDPNPEYAILRNDGLYEGVTTHDIREGRENPWIRGEVSSGSVGFDASCVITLRDAVSALSVMGFSGSGFVSIAVIDAQNVKMKMSRRLGPRRGQTGSFGTDSYKTELYPVQIGGDEIIEDLEPVLSEIWRQFGEVDGTPNIEEGEWVGGTVRLNRETLLDEGHR